MLSKVKINSIIKVVGRSYIPFKDRPSYLVIDLIEKAYGYDLLLFSENCELFWTSFLKKSKNGNIVIIN